MKRVGRIGGVEREERIRDGGMRKRAKCRVRQGQRVMPH
jgi:hypothetical protein